MEHIEISVPNIQTKERLLWLLDHYKSDGVELKKSKITEQPNGAMLVEFLENSSLETPFSSIKDPVKWQREIRKDRKLPK